MAPRKPKKRPGSVKRKSNSQGTRKRSSSVSKQLRTEIQGVVLVALGIIMSLSIYSKDLAGDIGNILGQIVGGLFGLTAYVIPLVVVIHGIIKIFKPQLLHQDRRFYLLLILLILISAIFQAGIYDHVEHQNKDLIHYLKAFYREGKVPLVKETSLLPVVSPRRYHRYPLLFVLKNGNHDCTCNAITHSRNANNQIILG